MSTYGDTTFNAARYNAMRPRYPEQFYQALFDYHTAPKNLAMDVGTGSGFVAIELGPHFKKVYGTDLSPTMIAEAKKQSAGTNVEFHVAGAEASPLVVEANSVDLLTAAECVHWMNHTQFFAEALRVLVPGGTLAYWLYRDPIFVGHPKANALYDKYCYGDEFMGPNWQQPGRNYLRTLMADVPMPQGFKDVVRHEYDPEGPGSSPLVIRKQMTLAGVRDYVQSWSAYHSWMSQNEGDIAEEFVLELGAAMGWTMEDTFEVSFCTCYVFAKKE